MALFNQFSYIFIGLIAMALTFLALRISRKVPLRTVIGIEVALAVLLLIGFFALRPGNNDVENAETARVMISSANDKPTFVEFFSNYCTGCLLARPAVDALVSEIDGEFNIIRVNIHSTVGRDLRNTYGFTFTPEFVLFGPSGQEIWRAHSPPNQDAVERARDRSS